MIIDWNFVLDVALICLCVILCVLTLVLISIVVDNAIKLHKKRVKKLKDLEEKVSQMESTVLWIRQDVDDAMLDIHHLENEVNEKGVIYNEKNNRTNRNK